MEKLRGTEEIVQILKERRNERQKPRKSSENVPSGTALLIGAGCSVSAGIPTAAGFVEEIQKQFPGEYAAAKPPKGYAECMLALGPPKRRDFVKKMVTATGLNPAHVAIGQLLKDDFVDRILTTNFDPLIIRACTLAGVDPAVYDFAALASGTFSPPKVALPAVFYLHGQHSGFIQLHTPHDFQRYGEALEPVIKDTDQQCVWIVVGYSGENDPTLAQLKLCEFESRVYWVAYNDEPPSDAVTEMLEKPENAFLVSGYDADRFFVSLAKELECYPTPLLTDPFSYLESLLQRVGVPKSWASATEGLERETVRLITDATARIHQAQRLSPAPTWHGEEELKVPEPRRNLILNLPRFNGRGYDNPGQLAASWNQPDFRVRAFQSNWGPLIVAAEHHAGTLRHCWVVCSPQVRGDFAHAAALISALAPGTECHAVNLENQNSILDVQQKIKDVYASFGPDVGLEPDEIIADITGGQSSMSAGMALATRGYGRAIEYLRQDAPLVQRDTKGNEIALSRDQIREQKALISLRTGG